MDSCLPEASPADTVRSQENQYFGLTTPASPLPISSWFSLLSKEHNRGQEARELIHTAPSGQLLDTQGRVEKGKEWIWRSR